MHIHSTSTSYLLLIGTMDITFGFFCSSFVASLLLRVLSKCPLGPAIRVPFISTEFWIVFKTVSYHSRRSGMLYVHTRQTESLFQFCGPVENWRWGDVIDVGAVVKHLNQFGGACHIGCWCTVRLQWQWSSW